MKEKSIYKNILIVSLIAAVMLSGCSALAPGGANAAILETGFVSTITMADTIETSGSLDAALMTELTWQTSGIVEDVFVEVGDAVKAGDILAVLQTTSVPANIITAQSDLVSAEKALDDLLNSNLSTAQAQLNLAKAQEAFEDAEDDIQSYQYKRGTSEDIEYWESQLVLAQDRIDLMEEMLNRTNGLSDADPNRAQAKSNLYDAQQDYNSTLATLNWYTSTPSDIDYNVDMGIFEVATAQLADAEREWERLKNGATEDDILTAQARIDAAQSTVNSLYIIAPFDGEVLSVDAIPGSQVFSNVAGITLANMGTLKVDALVDELDIARVVKGNPVEIELDAVPDMQYSGIVSDINPVGKTVNGLVKYTVTIALEKQDSPAFFGATANVTILVSEPQERLAVPISAIKNDSQGEYVLRITGEESTERVNIQSYELIDSLVTVTGDLNPGDELQLHGVENSFQAPGFGR